MCIDEALVFLLEMLPGQLKFFEQRVLVVSDKDIRRLDQTDEDFLSSG